MTINVISISGPPGSGKSTLAVNLADMLDCGVVGYDDFEVMTGWPPDAISAWLDDGAPMSAVRAPGLRDALLAHQDLVVYETPFGRLCPVAGDLISVSIWLDCPEDIALARKLGALAQAGRGDPGFADWIAGWLSVYPAITRRALLMQSNLVAPLADIRLNALDAQNTIAKSVLTPIKTALNII